MHYFVTVSDRKSMYLAEFETAILSVYILRVVVLNFSRKIVRINRLDGRLCIIERASDVMIEKNASLVTIKCFDKIEIDAS